MAGRYGNSGQADYATANELMNRICCELPGALGGRVSVHALCWGPWGPTRHGAGMVTAETEAKFAAKGVTLVDSATRPRASFRDGDRAHRAAGGGGLRPGPWERHEAEVGGSRWRRRRARHRRRVARSSARRA